MCYLTLMYEAISRELMRAARGRRSQLALSRRLGFTTNVLYAWESGRSFPTALQFLLMMEKSGVDTRAGFRSFYVKSPLWLDTMREFPSRAGIAAFLRDQRGQMPMHHLASLAGVSRFALSRWLKGVAEPKLPAFLNLLQQSSQRLSDWVALFVDPAQLPTLHEQWQRQQAALQAAYELPWTQGVLRALELESYQRLPRHRSGWIAKQLGVPQQVEEQALNLLERSGEITMVDGRWQARPSTVNLRRDPKAALGQRRFWVEVAAERALEDPGMFAYNVCGVSERDLERLKRMQRDFMQQARSIIADSQPVECVALVQSQIFALTKAVPNTGRK